MVHEYLEEEHAPMLLRLPQADHEALRCEQTLRVVSGKRASYFGRWGDRAVFVKLFFHKRSARRHWKRERRGIEALAARGIATPTLLYAGPVSQPKGYALVTEALSPVETLAEVWQRAGTHQSRIKLLERMGETLGVQHQASVLQQDPHLGNFLISAGQLYSVDLSKLRVRAQPLPRGEALANLALLLAQLEPRYDADAVAALRAYARVRGWADEVECLRLGALIDSARERRKQACLRKIFRECTAYACRRTRTGCLVYDKRYATPGFACFYEDPDSAFDGDTARFLKRGNTATVVVTRIDEVDVVIKRYNVKSLWHGVRRTLKRTRASISWENAHLLRFYGIPTPRPIAFIERRLGPARRVSYFVNEYIEGPSCRELFARDATLSSRNEQLAREIAEIFATLARYRIRHGDTKATNIIVRDEHPLLVDLDAMRTYRSRRAFRHGQRRDLERFLANWAGPSEVRRLFADALERTLERS